MSSDARVEWTVDLVNRKAALGRDASPAQPRNIDIADRNSLIIRGPQPATITGAGQPAREIKGTFLGKNVYLGELRTDGNGRLIVLGGRGNSGSVPPNQPLRNFANNNRWHDDVSDGPVNAIVTLPGQAPVVVHEPAWVVVAPPDFAPTVDPIVSLYDIAYQAGIDKGALRPEDRPSFTRHIKPMIARMVDMRWVDDFDEWDRLLPIDWDVLADPSPSAAAARQEIATLLQEPGPRGLPIAELSAAVCAAVGRRGFRRRHRHRHACRNRPAAAGPGGVAALFRQQFLPGNRSRPEPQGSRHLRPSLPAGPDQLRQGVPGLSQRDHGTAMAGGFLCLRGQLVADAAARRGHDPGEQHPRQRRQLAAADLGLQRHGRQHHAARLHCANAAWWPDRLGRVRPRSRISTTSRLRSAHRDGPRR